jgi:hypothetical protein
MWSCIVTLNNRHVPFVLAVVANKLGKARGHGVLKKSFNKSFGLSDVPTSNPVTLQSTM